MSLIDDSDRHFIYLQKLATHLLNTNVYPSMADAYRAARLILLNQESIKSVTALRRVQAEIAREAGEILNQGMDALTKDLMDAAAYEAEFSARLTSSYVGQTLAVPPPKQIESFIDKSIMTLNSGQRITSGTWAQYVARSNEAVISQYNSLVSSGYQQGLTVGQIAREIRKSTDGVLAQQANTLARTGLSHYATQAREAMALENSDIINVRVFTATFDNRTTLQCRDNHGKSWDITDQSYPKIPLHFGCRSAYVFAESAEEALTGRRSAVGGKVSGKQAYEQRKDRLDDLRERRSEQRADGVDPPATQTKVKYKGSKDADIFNPGQINAATTQDAWMKSQPAWFQDSALGPTRAKLLRDGGMQINQFVDMLGKPIPLRQLRELDAAAFAQAGL